MENPSSISINFHFSREISYALFTFITDTKYDPLLRRSNGRDRSLGSRQRIDLLPLLA